MNDQGRCYDDLRHRRAKLVFVGSIFCSISKSCDALAMAPMLKRAAITWDSETVSGASCYWDKKWLDLLQDEKSSSISYSTLISTASVLVSDLRAELIAHVRKKSAKQGIQVETVTSIPIVVAIPEGPLLPLAILVAHALNNPILLDSSSRQFYTVLVPLEPSEPRKRNLHILNDIEPALILTTPGHDIEMIEGMIDSLSFQDSPRPTLVNFPQLLETATQFQESQDSRIKKAERILTDGRMLMEADVGKVVSACADRLITPGPAIGDQCVVCSSQPVFEEARVSHIVYTSGTTGIPKGCISSIDSLRHYLRCKNKVYSIGEDARVLLASSLSFDPCLSDCLATFEAKATLVIAPKAALLSSLPTLLLNLHVSHVLCTPTLWGLMAEYRPSDLPSLSVVALGGEPIPRRIRQGWAREHDAKQSQSPSNSSCRLFATYGVTEACVYQTCGEIVSSAQETGNFVGRSFPGLGIRICREDHQGSLVDVDPGAEGEIILYGSQLDEVSGYLKRPELDYKFVLGDTQQSEHCVQHYRTGDRGSYDENIGSLYVVGRIVGEETMVKVNGVRVELGEIENAVIDDFDSEEHPQCPVVLDCMAKALPIGTNNNGNEIRSYCVLSDSVRKEVGIPEKDGSAAFVVSGSPLLVLLQARCADKLKHACMPRAFLVIPRLPLSPTGKRDRSGLPKLESSKQLRIEDQNSLPLSKHGVAGSKVAEVLTEFLNLHPSQESILTTTATFAMVGGDSMAAVRVTRALYAFHNNVQNNRFLGGEFGKLVGPFDVVNLLRSENLGAYVQMLDSQNLCRPKERDLIDETKKVESPIAATVKPSSFNDLRRSSLYDALFQATTLGQSSIAAGLLSVGADPNYGSHTGRLGKVTHRLQQRAQFRSSPLHIACSRGDDHLVKRLLDKEAKFNSPDASGYFPLHLASSGSRVGLLSEVKRICCVQHLLLAGAPLAMRDGNKQSVLHCAARTGHSELLKYIMDTWNKTNDSGTSMINDKHFFNWRDRWMRTPVHWAVLNGHVAALKVLLEMGCSATPFKPKVNNRSSAAVESPTEMCERLYDTSGGGKGSEIRRLLLSYTKLERRTQKP